MRRLVAVAQRLSLARLHARRPSQPSCRAGLPPRIGTDDDRRVQVALTVTEGRADARRRGHVRGRDGADRDAAPRPGRDHRAGPAVYGDRTSRPTATASMLEYRNRGYESVAVEPAVALSDGGTARRRPLRDHRRPAGDRRPRHHRGQRADEHRDHRTRAAAAARPAARLRRAAREPAAAGALGSVPARHHRGAAPRGRAAARRARQVEEAPPTTLGYRRRRRRRHAAAAHRRRRAGRGALRAGAARLLRDRPAQPVGQEPGGQPVHARQPALPRHRRVVETASGSTSRPKRAATASTSTGVLGTYPRAARSSTRRPICW